MDIHIPGELDLAVAELEAQRDAIFDAVRGGEFARGDIIESLDALGQAEAPQLGTRFGGWHHGAGHMSRAWVTHADGNGEVGLIGDTRTAIRDPFFWRWHRHVDDLAFSLQGQFAPHNYADAPPVMLRSDDDESGGDLILCFEDQLPDPARVNDDAAQAWARETFAGERFGAPAASDASTDTLETLMAETPFNPEDPNTMPVTHLSHRPFCATVRVRNAAEERRRVTVGLFLTPEAAAGDRRAWIELDKFDSWLEPGERAALFRPMRLSSVVRKPVTSEPRFVEPPAASRREQYCRCGWPYHLLLPRGTEQGMRFRLAAIVTDFALDSLSGESDCGSLSFCGAVDERFPDRREMGHPFNRPFGSRSIDQMLRAEDAMAVRDVRVRHVGAG